MTGGSGIESQDVCSGISTFQIASDHKRPFPLLHADKLVSVLSRTFTSLDNGIYL